MRNLSRRHSMALQAMWEDGGWLKPSAIPSGNGVLGGVAKSTLVDLVERGYAQKASGKEANYAVAFRITDKGKLFLGGLL